MAPGGRAVLYTTGDRPGRNRSGARAAPPSADGAHALYDPFAPAVSPADLPGLVSRLAAQAPGFATGRWKRVETEHFLFLYPDELGEWALAMAERMEAVHGAVVGRVGYAPEERVTVLVDDPGNVPNGSMSPGPLLYMWPTPPNPRSLIGENRGWGEILAVHELARRPACRAAGP